MQEPMPSGPKKGSKMDWEKWNRTLDRYHQFNEWDIITSFPTRQCLERLDLETTADDLEAFGRLGFSP